jgi:hypothetical protein
METSGSVYYRKRLDSVIETNTFNVLIARGVLKSRG